jgi:hypothetical protein
MVGIWWSEGGRTRADGRRNQSVLSTLNASGIGLTTLDWITCADLR